MYTFSPRHHEPHVSRGILQNTLVIEQFYFKARVYLAKNCAKRLFWWGNSSTSSLCTASRITSAETFVAWASFLEVKSQDKLFFKNRVRTWYTSLHCPVITLVIPWILCSAGFLVSIKYERYLSFWANNMLNQICRSRICPRAEVQVTVNHGAASFNRESWPGKLGGTRSNA